MADRQWVFAMMGFLTMTVARAMVGKSALLVMAASLGVLGLSLGLDAAGAADVNEAERLYRKGDLEDAASLARSYNSAEGFSLAARSTLVRAVYLAGESSKQGLFELAASDAERALALDERNVDAHLQIAIALGHIADLLDPVTAHLEGYAGKAKKHLMRALELAPNSGWAHGLWGIWHLQVVKKATPALAAAWYEADQKTGIDHCQKAAELDPGALSVRYGCALSLIELDQQAFGKEALATLKAISEAPGDTVPERLIKTEAKRLIRRIG